VSTPSDLQKLQFDYAWKWFAYHADQRIRMFNFMLVALGFLSAAVVGAIGNKMASGATATLCFVAGTISLIFLALDTRNRELVRLGEEVLTYLEKTVLFPGDQRYLSRKNRDIPFGIYLAQHEEDAERRRRFLCSGQKNDPIKDFIYDATRAKHRIYLRATCILFSGMFFWAGFWVLLRPQ
jgi:hypothetical protein